MGFLSLYGSGGIRPLFELENTVSKDVRVKGVIGHFHDEDF